MWFFKKKYNDNDLKSFGYWAIHSGRCHNSVDDRDIARWLNEREEFERKRANKIKAVYSE